MLPILSIVIPCYNEEQVLPEIMPLFVEQLDKMVASGMVAKESKILFVDDGSKDRTWELIQAYAEEYKQVEGLSQSRNRGHQSTILAGMMEAKEWADVVITIDCDGQDDIGCMDEMVASYMGGAEIVYGVRRKRTTDTFFKRFTAESFYKLLALMGAEVVFNHADYRLMSKKALNALADYKEVNLYLRGVIPLVGFNYAVVEYDRQERLAGESKYSLAKMLSLAFDGITSLTTKPIRWITGLGAVTSMASLFLIIWSVITHLMGKAVSGWASTIVIVAFFGGIQLISIGIIGEYIGKIYLETKQRPRYIIDKRTAEKEK